MLTNQALFLACRYRSLKVSDLMWNYRHTSHQRKESGARDITDHNVSNRNESSAHPAYIIALISLFFFELQFFTPARNTVSFVCPAPCTWKEKHHVVLQDARFIQILTCSQKSWKTSLMHCLAPFEVMEIHLANDFLIYLDLWNKNIYIRWVKIMKSGGNLLLTSRKKKNMLKLFWICFLIL